MHPAISAEPVARAIPLPALKLSLATRRLRRTCVYTTHPYTGADCRNAGAWRSHGGPLFSPWCPGFIDLVVDKVKACGRKEVLRTFGVGIKQLRAEQRALRS